LRLTLALHLWPEPSVRTRDASGGEHRERLPAPDSRSRRELGVRPVDFPLGEALQNFLERHPPFEARQRRAEAEVGAVAEGEVLADLAVNVEAVTVRVTTVVAVGRPKEKQHDAARRHLPAVELGIPRDVPGYLRRRRFVAEDLLDGVRDERAVFDQL